jgi:REP element-mobilizing transposase RayT
MARKLRLEFEGAKYHVISRGNYRKDIFEGRSAEAFEKTLFEACEKCGWKLHAYVIMSNHYHLALETPEGNLVDGMRWLQGVFGNRFNAFRGERGHVFQSRYKSLLVEEGRTLLGLVNYIHLNPVRAGIVGIEELRNYRWSSYPKYFERNVKAPLVRGEFLSALEFPDNIRGMKQYEEHLIWSEEGERKKRDEMQKRYCRGWAVAGAEYRKELKKMYGGLEKAGEAVGAEYGELKEAKWERVLVEELKRERKSLKNAAAERKASQWKVRIAGVLRQKTTATNGWIADQLCMGHPSRVRNLIRDEL